MTRDYESEIVQGDQGLYLVTGNHARQSEIVFIDQR